MLAGGVGGAHSGGLCIPPSLFESSSILKNNNEMIESIKNYLQKNLMIFSFSLYTYILKANPPVFPKHLLLWV